jgi:hypothetical protein
MTGSQWTALHGHLFPGDRAEHGAILRCGLAESEGVVRLLVREVRLADEQTQYVPGTRGHRALSAGFVLDAALDFAEDKSIYLAVHCHGGADEVAFSKVDLASHELGYPGLLERYPCRRRPRFRTERRRRRPLVSRRHPSGNRLARDHRSRAPLPHPGSSRCLGGGLAL